MQDVGIRLARWFSRNSERQQPLSKVQIVGCCYKVTFECTYRPTDEKETITIMIPDPRRHTGSDPRSRSQAVGAGGVSHGSGVHYSTHH